MSKQIAQFSFSPSWVDPDGNQVKPALRTIQCGYSTYVQGTLPVPAGTLGGTEIDIPFGELQHGASLIVIENQTGQELNMAWGGNWAPHLPVGGTLILAAPAHAVNGTYLSARIFLTQQQAADGLIPYMVMGD